VSAKREAQARATHTSIVQAALKLFSTNGYVATTIQAVADEADVAVQTVYATFGNKRELLRRVLESAVVGDDASDTLPEHPALLAIAAEPDPRRRAELDAALSTEISRRVAPIMRVLREAASVDAEFAGTSAQITAQRRADMKAAAKLLAGAEGLQIPLELALGTLYVLYNPEVYTSLTVDFGWTDKRYERWLAEMLYRTLLA
jgi:AcrR family transcriptional regulator